MNATDLTPTSATRRTAPEAAFGARIARALDESVGSLAPSTAERLAMARKAALRAHRTGPLGAPVAATGLAFASGRGSSTGFGGWGRASFVASAFLLVVACLVGIFHFEQQNRIEELADVDMAVLGDDVPIGDYADHGFNAFLKQGR